MDPLGQTLVVVEGAGWARREGEAIVEIRAGDVVWFAPRVRHWEGATFEATMTYVALHEVEAGVGVVVSERVSDDTFRRGPAKS